jgi:hypothetical protein
LFSIRFPLEKSDPPIVSITEKHSISKMDK